jgi:protein-S-isoprenylcysteine O-methyltransferase Ste14
VSLWRHAAAVLVLPGVVTVAVPALIVWRTGADLSPAAVVGIPLIAAGALLVATTIRLFVSVGRGTLAPWDPTKRLVVLGPYRYVRNPMISGVLFVLLGEAVAFASPRLFVWFGAAFAINAAYIPLVEERGLEERFGEDYRTYKSRVPRWLPRLRPWSPEETAR